MPRYSKQLWRVVGKYTLISPYALLESIEPEATWWKYFFRKSVLPELLMVMEFRAFYPRLYRPFNMRQPPINVGPPAE